MSDHNSQTCYFVLTVVHIFIKSEMVAFTRMTEW